VRKRLGGATLAGLKLWMAGCSSGSPNQNYLIVEPSFFEPSFVGLPDATPIFTENNRPGDELRCRQRPLEMPYLAEVI